MATIPVKIDEKVLHKFRKIKPSYMTMTAFLSSMLDFAYQQHSKELTNMALYINKNENLENNKTKEGLDELVNRKVKQEGKETKKRNNYQLIVPNDLKEFEEQIVKWIDERNRKHGKITEHSAKISFTGIRDIKSKYGKKVMIQQFDLAIVGCWKGITLHGFEKNNNKQFNRIEPEIKHPAQKVVQFDEMGRII